MPRMRWGTWLTSSIGLIASASSPVPIDDAAIISAVLTIWYRSPLPELVVLQSESNDPALFTHPPGCPPAGRAPLECTDWSRDSLPPELLEAARNADFSDRKEWKTSEVPLGTRLLLPAVRDSLFAPGAGGWPEFFRRFPGARGFEELSRPVVSADGRQAVIRAAHRCGPRCGEGGVAWLARSLDGRWRVHRWFRHWMS
jgi:hypothetical protein